MAREKWDVILTTMAPTKNRKEILFRIARDDYLYVEYGREQVTDLLDSFRALTIKDKIDSLNIDGLIEVSSGIRNLVYNFDPVILPMAKLIEIVKEVEADLEHIEDVVFEDMRLWEFPMVFNDSYTKKSIEKYLKEVRSDAPNCIEGSNLKYCAQANGVSEKEFKQMFLADTKVAVGMGFWCGIAFMYPLDPSLALSVPKYNPARVWTAAGTVSMGGTMAGIYTIDLGGGYQCFGRSIQTYQRSQKHKEFKNSPNLIKPKDLIRYRFAESEEQIEDIRRRISDPEIYGEYEYDKTPYLTFSVKKYLDFLEDKKPAAEKLKKKQLEASKDLPL